MKISQVVISMTKIDCFLLAFSLGISYVLLVESTRRRRERDTIIKRFVN